MDKCLRRRWNAYEDMSKKMLITLHFGGSNRAQATNLSPPYHQFGSHTKESDKRKRRRKRRKKSGTTTSQDVGNGEDFTIYKDEGSVEEEDNTESNKAKVKIADSVRTGSSGFFVFFPDNDHKGAIDSAIDGSLLFGPQSLCNYGNKDDHNNYVQCKAYIGQDELSLISYSCDCARQGGDTIVVCFKSVVGSWEKEAN